MTNGSSVTDYSPSAQIADFSDQDLGKWTIIVEDGSDSIAAIGLVKQEQSDQRALQRLDTIIQEPYLSSHTGDTQNAPSNALSNIDSPVTTFPTESSIVRQNVQARDEGDGPRIYRKYQTVNGWDMLPGTTHDSRANTEPEATLGSCLPPPPPMSAAMIASYMKGRSTIPLPPPPPLTDMSAPKEKKEDKKKASTGFLMWAAGGATARKRSAKIRKRT